MKHFPVVRLLFFYVSFEIRMEFHAGKEAKLS